MNWLRRLFVGTIPRDIHDEIVAELRAQLAEYRHDNRRMLRTITKMKVAGGSIPRVLSGGALPPRTPDPIEQAIVEALDANPKTRNPGPLRNRHRTWAERKLAADSSESTKRFVLSQLRSWGVVEDSEDDDDDGDVIAVTVNT